MNKISTSDVKKLRDLTGAGFLDCKEALENSSSDIDKAIEFLRKKGISSAQKKGDRKTSEGLIAVSKDISNKEASIIEVNSETDFVARNENFQNFVFNLSKINLNQKGNLDNLIKTGYDTLGLSTFFTSGPEESRAWTIEINSKAADAAGVIHTDFQKKFIRAETVAHEDFIKYKGFNECKNVGKLRLEGKDYLVNDGDVMYFRIGS